MKKYLMVFISVLLLSTAASAQTDGYLGLFADLEHTTWCAAPATIPGNFTMYIFALPNEDGLFCAEFQLVAPSDPTLILATQTPNPGHSIIMGDPTSGVTLCFLECQTDWVWIYSILVIVSSTNQNVISLAPHPDAGGPNFPSCIEPMRPVYVAKIFNNLYVNYVNGVDPECDATATAEMTWGAIKSMYTE